MSTVKVIEALAGSDTRIDYTAQALVTQAAQPVRSVDAMCRNPRVICIYMAAVLGLGLVLIFRAFP